MLIAKALSKHSSRKCSLENRKTLKNEEGWMGDTTLLTALKRYEIGLKDILVRCLDLLRALDTACTLSGIL